MPNREQHKQPRNYFPLPALLFLLLLVCACDDRKTPLALPYLSESETILAFGDSLTYGTGARTEASFPKVLEALSQRKVINAGVPGETTAGGLKRLPDVLSQHKPSLVLLCLGGNDFLRKVPGLTTRQNLEAMINILKQSSVPVVLLAVPRPGLGLQSDKIYTELAEQYEIVLVEDIISDVLGQRALKSDAVHPNAEGYYQIAQAVYQTLDRYGAF